MELIYFCSINKVFIIIIIITIIIIINLKQC